MNTTTTRRTVIAGAVALPAVCLSNLLIGQPSTDHVPSLLNKMERAWRDIFRHTDRDGATKALVNFLEIKDRVDETRASSLDGVLARMNWVKEGKPCGGDINGKMFQTALEDLERMVQGGVHV
jgi:hypothetical protein